MMCINIDLSSWRLVLELFFVRMFLTAKQSFSESKTGFDLRLVRLILVSVSRYSPGPPVNLRLRTSLDVRFDSLDFVFSAWVWF